MSSTSSFHLFERVRVAVPRYGINAGEEGEITRVLGDGFLEVTVTDPPSAYEKARLGSLTSRPPFAHQRVATFAPAEVKWPWER